MDTNPFNIADIIAKRFRNESLDSHEQRALESWIDAHPKNKQLFDELLAQGGSMKLNWLDNLDEESAWQRIEKKREKKRSHQFMWRVAATIALVSSLCLSLWIYKTDFTTGEEQIATSQLDLNTDDVGPALLGAKIILANGKEVKVDDTLNIASGSSMIENELNFSSEPAIRELIFHTLVVPAANFFKITLADGTAVWVNAVSELRFPEQFGEGERRVYLKGEAYFEVAKDEERPFFVETEEVDIRVLGTHFNVSAYGKNVKTSLAEGAVEVMNDTQSVIIAPGQSAEWNNGNLKVRTTNLQRDLAWKNNIFYFRQDHIVNIANQLKRWYNIDVSLSQDVPLDNTYSGEIGRNVNLSEVLTMLAFVSDLKFTLNTNKLLITKKNKL
ncbi:FecR family protein [Sphingobacterium chuzhouense]|uniref:FecR family protein n=1 Tax=Sphingobacterium chuzhouense TaxID=1742264 RepID=A0ABR7XNM4_9SPHI|nr:FecR family protein [Sphingobacterium chuzhouense]MBD1420442.1 FecR family protein [Sphingobacterium chuzhouense]